VERLQGREEESSRRCSAELSELRDRLGASSARLEAAGTSLESLRASLDSLQARISELDTASRDRAAALGALEADLGGRLGELEVQVADVSGQRAAARELEEKLSEASAHMQEKLSEASAHMQEKLSESSSRLQERLSRTSSELEEQLARHATKAEERHADSRAEAERLRGSLQALGSQCTRELEARCPRVEAHCQEAAEQLLGERLALALQECEEEEARRLERRVAPMGRELSLLAEGAEAAAEERQRQAELMERHDFPTLWESLAHLASRLTDIQEVVDNLSLKGAGLTGC